MKRRPYTEAERKAIELIKNDPDKPLIEVGRKLVELQLVNKPEHIYNLTRTNSKLDAPITQIRERNAEILSRDIVPQALKIHKNVLKDKNINDTDKLPWVKLAEDKEFGADETKRPIPPQHIHIDQVQAVINQSIIQNLADQQPQDVVLSGEVVDTQEIEE